ncbi:MAG: hypothetical protein ACK4V1_02480 [Burkholderiaceae bacterium]
MRSIGAVVGVVGSLLAFDAGALTINVMTPDRTPITTGFRYTVEEDRTHDVIPGCTGITPLPAGCPASASADTLSLRFHRSYMPVVATGESAGASAAVALTDTTKRYFVSVLPLPDTTGAGVYAMGGAPVRPGQTSVDVVVDALPLKTAQISVFLFNDDNPINNVADAPPAQERGLCGFEVHLYDAGGTYGASGGRIFADTFGNPLGTTYNADGSVASMGSAILKTDVNGVLRIKNLAPAKYTIFALPPLFRPTEAECPGVYQDENGTDPNRIRWGQWTQTSTIEGTWGIDAWVKAGEPPYFKEFGPPGHHVEMGFVRRFNDLSASTGPSRVSGRIVNTHMSRPPNFAFYNGEVFTQCWIGLNEVAAGVGGGRGVYAQPCNADGTFSIDGLKAGTRYQLAVWDQALDQIFALYDFVTPVDGSAVALNDVPVFNWFAKWEGKVCYDRNADGFCAPDEPGIPGQAINLRWRDGSIYQATATDEAGNYELTEIFPFFNWLVSEVDFARFKATGATVVVDAGGPVPPDQGWTMPSRNKLNPQPQPENGGLPYRTETGPVLLQGTQNFMGTTNLIDWGKAPYRGNENGGISGIVYYASTRAEADPRFAFGENNEPGIPDVTVRLYRADPTDRRKILDVNGDSIIDANDAVAEVKTDSWDAANPTNCAGDNQMPSLVAANDCFDGLRNYNQVRPAVFDGGFAFTDYEPNGIGTGGITPLVPGNYIVEVVPPPGYEVQKEEDKNVDFGEYYAVATQALPPECVGERPYPVPAELSLFPGVPIPPEYRDNPPINATSYPPTYVGKKRPLCDRLAVTLAAQQNAPANFYLFTKAPVAGHIVGMILDDLANEFSPFAPAFGEKYGPPFMPISLRDQGGREFSRVYSDRFGTYNALVPSTFSYNIPIPSGVSPNMVQACLNSPYRPKFDASGNPVLDANGAQAVELDPHFNKSYTQFCYTFQYLPGKTTYLDTPVLPIAAFAGPQQFALDCEAPSTTPEIRSVTNTAGTGPWVSGGGQQIVITSLGQTEVLNPLYNQDDPSAVNPVTSQVEPRLITRDYGFGTLAGQVLFVRNAGTAIESVVAVNVPQADWTDSQITVTVPPGLGVGSATVLVRRAGANGRTTPRGVAVHIGGPAPIVVGPARTYKKIQDAIDAAPAGALITVEPGIYEESVIVNKRVRLQGFGAGGTLINAVKQPTERQQQWREKICSILFADANGAQYLLPGQALPVNEAACRTGDTVDNAPLLFGNEEGAAVFVMIKSGDSTAPALQIDGFTITGADQGGGIMVNGNADRIEIANNRVTGNQGIFSGGIRIGHVNLVRQFAGGELRYVSARTPDATIHHNEIVQNGNTAGGTAGGGGGISLFNGVDGYRVTHNFICGNFSTGDGGGIAHIGLSATTAGGFGVPTIAHNEILFNQSFNQFTSPNGGGLAITGLKSLVAQDGRSAGTGHVLINANTFQGNLAGAGDGGAISLAGINGTDALNDAGPLSTTPPYRIDIVNNVIQDNVAGVAGGGIALQDAVNVRIVNNTIVRNDSVATGSRAFVGSNVQSTPQPGAGIAARTHSPALAGVIGANDPIVNGLSQRLFSNPVIHNSIVRENRQFYWQINPNADQTNCLLNTAAQTCYGLVPNVAAGDAPVFSDLGVVGGAYQLTANYSMLTSTTGVSGANNLTSDPLLRCAYYNGGRDAVIQMLETTTQVNTAAAFDEGGNFIDTRFGPLTLLDPVTLAPYGDPRILDGSPANDSGQNYVATQPLTSLAFALALSADRIGVPRNLLLPNSWSRGAYEGNQNVPPCGP